MHARLVTVLALVIVDAGCTSSPPADTPGPRGHEPGDVLINELAWGPVVGDVEFVELFNPRDVDVTIDGLLLRDRDDHELALTGTVPPKQFLVLVKGTDYAFGWHQGEGASIVDAEGEVIDNIAGDDAVLRGLSYGRFPDGDPATVILPVATPGEPNVAPDPNCPCCGSPCQLEALCSRDDDTGLCEPGADEHCAALAACSDNGACGVFDPGSGAAAVCAPTRDEHCLESTLCFNQARCSHDGATGCVLADADDCAASEFCSLFGLCGFATDRCARVASTPEDCALPSGELGLIPCANRGDCSVVNGVCVATSLTQCEAATICNGADTCELVGNRCVATTIDNGCDSD